ncbi:MAG: hupR1 2 [Flavipsychrobacter sp.]|nr:hupR1 2 [Flavipsychrobacter sp.]
MITPEKIKVLYIDDELNNLNAFKATYRFDYTVFIAQDIPKAYEHLAAHADICAVLCDQRMPDKTGVEFFEEMREQYPDPVRMLITGYTDVESVINAINKGHIFRYIKKPWTDVDIKSAIEEANKYYSANSLLSNKNKELKSAYEELGKFAYNVTHDMRGPLLSVIGALELAKTMDSLEEVKDILDMMDGAVKKLDEFIKNMHEYYNLKRSELIFNEIDFNKVVADISAFFRIGGKMDNVQFNYHVVQNEVFFSDEIGLKIILNNLMSNAFKYQRRNADNKFVDVSIEVADNKVTIIVKDNGIGIEESHIDSVFKMFYRATSAETGSGFGLYNVKDAVTKLNGTVELTSVVNEGTIFKVIIPGKQNVTN